MFWYKWLMLALVICNNLYAHSVGWTAKWINGDVILEFKLDNEIPFRKAPYRIEFNENPFGKGLSDEWGRVRFSPNQKGKWKVAIYSPNDGHGTVAVLHIKEDGLTETQVRSYSSDWLRVAGAVASLLGVFGIAHLTNVWWARRNSIS